MTPARQPTDEVDLRELALRAREGDVAAAYEILGEQVPADTWIAAIKSLESATGVDLELVAHRTLRRPPSAVTLAVLALIRHVRTPRAAFVARAIARLRSEDHVIAEANQAAEELARKHRPLELLADDRPLDALYALLARSVPEQAALLKELERDERARESLIDAARDEYERLQELSRDTRWRSGSYRHLLRHAIADFALVSGAGGKFEDQAFRLLQQRTENPQANTELLAHLPVATRTAYLSWVLNRPSGKEEVERTIFALREVEERYPTDVERSAVRRLLVSGDLRIAAAAAEFLIRTAPDDGTDDRSIAELLGRVKQRERSSLVELIAREAPQRIRLDLWPHEVDGILGDCSSAAVTEALVRTLEEAVEASIRERALRLIMQRPIEDLVEERIASASLARATHVASPELRLLFESSPLRRGLWRAAVTADPAMERELLAALVDHETPDDAAQRLVALHGSLRGEQRESAESLALAGLAEGTVSAEPLATSPLGTAIVDRAVRITEALERRLSDLRELVSHGDRAADLELARAVRGLVERAIERSVGNDRIIADYARVIEAVASSEEKMSAAPSTELLADEVDSIAAKVAKAGLYIALEGGQIVAEIDAGAEDIAAIRALAIVDQRAERAAEDVRPTARATRAAVAKALAQAGLAERCMHALAVRGPLLQPVTALSASARQDLFDAAVNVGFTPPDEWAAHPILGQWAASAPGAVHDGRDPAKALVSLADLSAELRELEERLAGSRVAARRAFAAAADMALSDLEETVDAYVQFWLGLDRVGISRIAAPGAILEADQLDPTAYEVIGDARAARYVVRSGGVSVDGEALRRARVEAYD